MEVEESREGESESGEEGECEVVHFTLWVYRYETLTFF